MHKLNTLYLFWGQKSIWGHRGQIFIFTKKCITSFMLLSKFMYFIHLHHICGINRETGVSQGSRSQSRQDTPSVTAAMSSSSFFLLSGNTSFSHTSLHPILTKLSQSDRYLDHYSGTDNGGVRGHDGVTGVKKFIFIRKASSPTEYLALTRDLCICSSLTPSTKVMVLKNCQGSFGVTGVKSSFSQKRHQVLQIM